MANYFGLDQTRIITIPFTRKVFEAIVKEDVLLMPSVAEGTPYAMIESMACGRPALGTPVGGIPELIKNGIDGWLTNGHQINDISEKMEEMWRDRNRWSEFGENARKQIGSSYDQLNAHQELLSLLMEDLHTAS
jgi:glycosyltransferase involved in cell wall biosynthesis